MDSFIGSILILFVLLVPTAISRGATVHLADGQTVTGTVKFTPGLAIVKPEDHSEKQFKLAEISSLDFSQQAAEPITDAPGLGGLKAEYFLGTTFDPARRQILRCDPGINFVWKFGGDASFMPNAGTWVPFCVRWTGQIRPLFGEQYTLRLRETTPEGSEIHAHVWIDQKLMINDGADTGQIAFEAGKIYDIKIDLIASRMDRAGKPAMFRLIWESPSQRRQIVPATCLYVSQAFPDRPAVCRIISPANSTQIFLPGEISIEGQGDGGQKNMRFVDLMADRALLHRFTAPPFQFDWKNARPGDYQIRMVATEENDARSQSAPVRVIVADNDNGNIPAPWARFNIGDAVQQPITFADQKLTITRTGGELYFARDQCQFVYQILTGDGEIIARLNDLTVDAPNAQAVAGLMIRRTLGDNAKECGILYQPGTGTIVLHRTIETQTSMNTSSPSNAPGYMKLVREGSIIRAFRSDDDTNWQLIEQNELDLPETVFIGVVVSAQSSGKATAVFDGMAVNPSSESHKHISAQPGLILSDGTKIAGHIVAMDKDTVTLERESKNSGSQFKIALKIVARINIRNPDNSAAETPDAAWRGILLNSGDLYEGEVKILDAHGVQVTSDVFGPKYFDAGREIVAIVMGESKPPAAKFELGLVDGSILPGSTVELLDGAVMIDTPFAGRFRAEEKDILFLKTK